MINITCANCGQVFGLTEDRHTRLRASGDTFYCPSGHGNVFRPSDLEKAQKRIQELEGTLLSVRQERDRIADRLHAAVRRENTLRGWITRLRRKLKER